MGAADNERKVTRGQRLHVSAQTWGGFIDALKSHKRERFREGSGGPLTAGILPNNTVLIENTVGTLTGMFNVLGVQYVLLDADDDGFNLQGRPGFSGINPAAATSPIVILTGPAPAGAIVSAVISGIATCYVKMIDPAHTWANPVAGVNTHLESVSNGGQARILWTGDGGGDTKPVGTTLAVVNLIGVAASDDGSFPVELTGTYNSSTGYPWTRLGLDLGIPGFVEFDTPETGEDAFTADDNQLLQSGTRGRLFPQDDGYQFIPEVLYREKCVTGYWYRQRSLDGEQTWQNIENLGIPCSPAAKPSGCDDTGWGWVAGLLYIDDDPDYFAECLKLTVLSAEGFCAGIDTEQEYILRTQDGITWTSQKWDCDLNVWVDADFLCDPDDEVYGPAIFTVDGTTGVPTLKVCGVSRALTPVCGGPGAVVFSGGGPALCDGELPMDVCEDNTFTVQIECVCCPIDGWQGEGWYCVLDEGFETCEDEGAVICPLELLEEDMCNPDFVICSCKFDTEEEAAEECACEYEPGIDCSGSTLIPMDTAISGDYETGVPFDHWWEVEGIATETTYHIVVTGLTPEDTDITVLTGCNGSFTSYTGPADPCVEFTTSETVTAGKVQINVLGTESSTGSYTITVTSGPCP